MIFASAVMSSRRSAPRSFFFLIAVMGALSAQASAPKLQSSESTATTPSAQTFRLHVFAEPTNFRPHLQKGANAGFILTQTHWGYLRYQDGKLLPGLARECRFVDPLQVSCELQKNLKFSDGSAIEARHWRKPLELMLDSQNPAPRADLLFSLKNARRVLEKKAMPSELGVRFFPERVVFQLERPNADFLYQLTSSHWAPLPDRDFKNAKEISAWPTPGPYRFANYAPSKSVMLSPNPFFFDQKANARPQIEFLFVSEDSVALNLYEKGQLDFNRRLATLMIPQYRNRPDFHEVPLLRFDYIGLRSFLNVEQRRALAQTLKFEELQSLFHAPPRPGCPGVPKEWMTSYPCHNLNLEGYRGKNLFGSTGKIKFIYSKMGGEDHRRGMEWFQAQWKKHLALNIELSQVENSYFVSQLEKNDPVLFRKGLSLNRPTCLAAVEHFESSSPENYLHLKDEKIDFWIQKLRTSLDKVSQRELCGSIIARLIDQAHLVPTGPYTYAVLAKPKWSGWSLTELGVLDLSELQLTK